ncbi:C6 transcription factor [Colletotrichum truncatum]|uniref:C6 transcription factor n=1 Tax=Colletotrichum truncatum TaxID=5467 RepID=A0ACC3ZLE6_COLTU|nr:C6 transcription factor [Colletotrichum truncatum]KAF6786854.1 C6 transcription factor [Colletotrichum truncatum]
MPKSGEPAGQGHGSPVRKIRESTFRVSTADDFNSSSRNDRARRRSGLPSTACNTCRSRKVKCEVNISPSSHQGKGQSAGLPRCQACQQSNIECQWNTVDKRKRRRTCTSRDTPQKQGTDVSEIIVSTDHSQEQLGIECQHGDLSTDQEVQQRTEKNDEGGSNTDDLGMVEKEQPEIPNDNSNTIHAELYPVGRLDSQLDSREFFALENMDMSCDWSEVQDFVFDFEGMENLGNVNWNNIAEDGQSIETAETPQTRSKAIRLRLYRRFGPTAVLPGLRKLSIAVNTRRKHIGSETEQQSRFGAIRMLPSQNIDPMDRLSMKHKDTLSDDSPYDLPLEAIRRIADVFFARFGGHFPFVEPQILDGHVRSGQASSFVIHAIAALTMRFCPLEIFSGTTDTRPSTPWRNGTYFLKRAKEQLVTLLAIPTTDVVSGILILAWVEFGDNYEAGLWMLSGMAIRMAQDMGLHRPPEKETNPTVAFWDRSPLSPDGKGLLSDEMSKLHQQKSKLLLFWTVFTLDVSVSLLTGRPPTLKRKEVDVPLPTAQDMKGAQLDFQETVSMKNLIFPELARFMLSFSEAVELLNQTGSEDDEDASGPDGPSRRKRLAKVKEDIMDQYQSLNHELTFTIDNYKKAAAIKQAGVFLKLHVYVYTFIILLSQGEIRDSQQQPQDGVVSGVQQPKDALVASQKIVQIMSTAELIDNCGFLSTPFINQGLFISAITILEGQQMRKGIQTHRVQDFFSLVSGSDVDYLRQKLQEMSQYFKGIGATLAALEQRKRELVARKSRDNQHSEDEESDDDKNEGFQLSDGGIVNRYSIPDGS